MPSDNDEQLNTVTPSPRHTQANVDFTEILHTQYSNDRERENELPVNSSTMTRLTCLSPD